ncbi:MAG: biotin carboxylase N-terminal domain-containing protein [Planctomycetota bacterium]
MAFTKLLIANRGEIAARVLRSARAEGYACVAVYSDADRDAPHVRAACEAVRIGPGPVAASYLDPQALLRAARLTGADAVHPGYGFLSENAGFARACAEAGLVFVGPPPAAIELMGDKARAKARMLEAGVPCLPGYQGDAQDLERLGAAATEVGFPLLVKAAAGGGGRGMRRVDGPEGLAAAVAAARSEAEHAFGDGRLLLERLVTRARHVEVQVLADTHGAVVHLGERECSAQRRYQKVLEECPSPAVDADLRARMGQAAVDAAAAIGYVGAGTVEFLLAEDGAFYFLEMNTRLQVEHPVTELVYGVDLVALQLAVAAGAPLPFTQAELVPRGHAIEARLYAEDPAQGFAPQAGELLAWSPAEGLRCDHSLRARDRVSPFYDPLLAKLIGAGADREQARRRLLRGLERTVALGLPTNRGYLARLVAAEPFVAGALTTESLAALGALTLTPDPPPEAWALALVLGVDGPREPAWGARALPRALRIGELERSGWLHPAAGGWEVELEGEGTRLEVELRGTRGPRVRARVGDVEREVAAVWTGDALHLSWGPEDWCFRAPAAPGAEAEGAPGDGGVRARGAGRVVRVEVAPGDVVTADRTAAVVESMKIETELPCGCAGTVRAVHVSSGAQVQRDQVLVEVEPD